LAAGAPVPWHPLVPIETAIFLRGPIPLIAPRLEIGLGPLRQEHLPCCLEVGADPIEGGGCAAGAFPRMAPPAEPTSPAAWIFMMRNAGAERDRADADVTIKDVPAFVGSFQIAAAGEFGHGPIEARQWRTGKHLQVGL
jgi:hypothetical protein